MQNFSFLIPVILSLVSTSSGAFAASLMDPAKDQTGKIMYMDMPHAEKYCQQAGSRLPTIRELAVWASQEHGSKLSDDPTANYGKVDGSNTSGQADNFYFQGTGTHYPQGNFGDQFVPQSLEAYWSSSEDQQGSIYSFYLMDSSGNINNTYKNYDDNGNAVRCVQAQ